MNRINRSAVVAFGIVVLVTLVVGTGLMGGGWGYGGWGMMGPGVMTFGPLGWLLMPLMWLVPIGLIVLTVLGIGWVVGAVGGGTSAPWPAAPARACPSCGRGVQADWRVCPHCGAALTSA